MNKSRLLGTVCLIVVSLAFSSILKAATYTLNQDLDISNDYLFNNGTGYDQHFSITLPTLYVGDTIDHTINFSGGKRMVFADSDPSDVEQIIVWYLQNEGARGSVLTTGSSFEFLGVEGELLTANPDTAGANCQTCVSTSVLNNLTDTSFSFSGIHVVTEIIQMPEPFGIYDGQITVGLTDISVSTVPIPASVWLFGSGLLAMVGMARRKATHQNTKSMVRV